MREHELERCVLGSQSKAGSYVVYVKANFTLSTQASPSTLMPSAQLAPRGSAEWLLVG